MHVAEATFGAGLDVSEYVECSFDGSRLAGGHWGRARFVRCSFREVRLRRFFGFDAEFVDCTFSGRAEAMVFHGSPIDGPEDVQALADAVADLLGPAERAALQARIDRSEPRTVNEFRGNDFSGMELVDVGFRRGIDLRAQILPVGADYVLVPDARAAVARARAGAGDHPRLRHVAEDVEDGQEQLLLRASEWEQDRDLFRLLTT
jgi:hypothetical protein